MSNLRKFIHLDTAGTNEGKVDANGGANVVIYNSSGTEILTTVNRGQVDIYSPLPVGTNTIGKVYITDGVEDVDIVDSSIQTIAHAHGEIHKGNHFHVNFLTTGVSNNATAAIRLLNGATKELHGLFNVTVEGKAYVQLFESTTYTGAGTALTIFNNNRVNALSGSPTASTALAYHTPTVNALGTDLTNGGLMIPAGVRAGSIGGSSASRNEQVGAASTDYYILVTSKAGAGSANDISIEMDWYEETI